MNPETHADLMERLAAAMGREIPWIGKDKPATLMDLIHHDPLDASRPMPFTDALESLMPMNTPAPAPVSDTSMQNTLEELHAFLDDHGAPAGRNPIHRVEALLRRAEDESWDRWCDERENAR